MPFCWDYRKHLSLPAFVLKWFMISLPMGITVGSAISFFLWSLDQVTHLRWRYPWSLYLLPLAGAVSALIYHHWGRSAEAGTDLILEQIHQPGGGVPSRMAPLVLICTLMTHLFGGSAGREGTAVQMGGGLAGTWGRWLGLNGADMSILLMTGIAAGFGAVFGTPVTGAVFALEVLAIGRRRYQALIPCLIASLVGDQVNTTWGLDHMHYHIATTDPVWSVATGMHWSWGLTTKIAIAALFFGLASSLFVELTHVLNGTFKQLISRPWLRPMVGGCVVILLVWGVGNRDYLGIGEHSDPHDLATVTIQSCFLVGGAGWFSWWWKLLFTAVTVSSGFKGGEVTPLFFIGAALGNVLGQLLGAPVDLMAGLGFVAVFAGATKTPLACTIMAVELFAPENGALLSSSFVMYAAVACFVAYCSSGRSSIYHSPKHGFADTKHCAVQ